MELFSLKPGGYVIIYLISFVPGYFFSRWNWKIYFSDNKKLTITRFIFWPIKSYFYPIGMYPVIDFFSTGDSVKMAVHRKRYIFLSAAGFWMVKLLFVAVALPIIGIWALCEYILSLTPVKAFQRHWGYRKTLLSNNWSC